MPDFLRRYFLPLIFFFALTTAYIPAQGQEPAEIAKEELPAGQRPTISWNGESVAVICPPMFRKALEPWVYYRLSQGYKVYVLEEPRQRSENANRVPYTTPSFLKSRILALVHSDPSVKYLLLIGDATPELISESTASERLIPTARVEALVISGFGREKDIATDNYYADLNDDNFPELAVGRLTADTPEELSVMISKIIRYETETDLGFWHRRINLIAGVGGFSPLIDTQIEASARYILSEMIDEGFDLSLTHANWKSAWCPPPELFRSVTIERLNEGCLFWVYMGHGFHKALDGVRTPLEDYAIFVAGDSQYVDSRNGLPIAVFCACYTGAFDALEDCIAEDLLRQPNGPVAVIASSRVAMPYGMAVFGLELLDEVFGQTQVAGNGSHEVKNLGTIFLNAKRNMLTRQPKERSVASTIKNTTGTVLSMPANAVNTVGTRLSGSAASEKRPLFVKRHPAGEAKQSIRNMIDTMAWLSDPTSNRLNEQLIDHLHLFHLFGDPLLRLPLPKRLPFDSPQSVEAGNTLTVKGKIGPGGVVVAELATPRIRPAAVPKERIPFKTTEEANAEFLKTYLATNNRSVIYIAHKSKGETFELKLPVPDDLDGEYIVRVFGANTEGVSVGSAKVTVTPRSVAAQKNATSQGKRLK